MGSDMRSAKVFNCSECRRLFRTMRALKEHVQDEHPRKRIFECSFCHHKFLQMSSLRRHLTIKHPDVEPIDLCSQCDRKFLSKLELENHVQKVHVEQQSDYQCELCHFTYSNQEALAHHREWKHFAPVKAAKRIPESKYVVPSHPPLFRNPRVRVENVQVPEELMDEIRDSKNQPSFQCDYCDKCYTHPHSLSCHVYRKHSKREIRSESASQSASSQQADSPKNEYGLYNCKYCDGNFVSVNSMQDHLKRYHHFKESQNLSRPVELPTRQDLNGEKESTQAEQAESAFNKNAEMKTLAAQITKEAAGLIRQNSMNFTVQLFRNFFMFLGNSVCEVPAEPQNPGCSAPKPVFRNHDLNVHEHRFNREQSKMSTNSFLNINSYGPPSNSSENQIRSQNNNNNNSLSPGDLSLYEFNVEQLDQIMNSFF